jgi:hypothetical protein
MSSVKSAADVTASSSDLAEAVDEPMAVGATVLPMPLPFPTRAALPSLGGTGPGKVSGLHQMPEYACRWNLAPGLDQRGRVAPGHDPGTGASLAVPECPLTAHLGGRSPDLRNRSRLGSAPGLLGLESM